MSEFQHFKRGSHLVKSRINARQNMRRKAKKLGKRGCKLNALVEVQIDPAGENDLTKNSCPHTQ